MSTRRAFGVCRHTDAFRRQWSKSLLSLDSMDDKWVSTAIVLVAIIIMVVVWLPRRARDSMRKVAEHRQDRYSPSLHLIDERSGTRFSDGVTPTVKGVLMQPNGTASSALTKSRIARVRRLRREAIRRRRILVLSLLALGIVLTAAILLSPVSSWWSIVAYIPCAVVLAFGAHASAQAREWERRVHAAHDGRGPSEASHMRSNDAPAAADRAISPSENGQRRGHVDADEPHASGSPADDTPTDVMESRQIREALDRSRAGRDRRSPHRADAADAGHGGSDEGSRGTRKQGVSQGVSVVPSSMEDAMGDDGGAAKTESVDGDAQSRARAEVSVEAAVADDPITSSAGQDLISFSLGASSDEDNGSQGPESREIQSTRQVSRAVPPETPARRSSRPSRSDADAAAVEAMEGRLAFEGQGNAESFHRHELEADIDVPDATSESLAVGVESILARRSR